MFKKIFLATFFLFAQFSLSYGFAECIEDYRIEGEEQGIINEQYNYKLIYSWDNLPSDTSALFRLDNKKISDAGDMVVHTFPEGGEYLLKVELRNSECRGTLEKKIRIFDKNILYIGDDSDALKLWFEKEINDSGYLFVKKNPLRDVKDSEEQLIAANLYKTNQLIIINQKDFHSYLESYIQARAANPDIGNKKIIIITDVNKNLFKRIISQYAKELEHEEIMILHPSNFLNLLSDISLKKDYAEQSYITHFSWNFKKGPKLLVISHLVDELLKNNFPIGILGILLSLSVVALVVSFFRQVVGLSVFGVYWPILFALVASEVGLQTSIVLFLIAILTTAVIKKINNHLYLLHSARVSILITFFLLFLLVGYYVSGKLGFSLFSNGFTDSILIIFPIIITLVIADKVFSDFKMHTKAWWLSFFEFIMITSISYGILQWKAVGNLLLSYPELLLLILLVNIIIGRFSGLQMVELLRFMPLIKKYWEDDEE